jgi:hypothetical protein
MQQLQYSLLSKGIPVCTDTPLMWASLVEEEKIMKNLHNDQIQNPDFHVTAY